MLWGPAREPPNHEVCDTVKILLLECINHHHNHYFIFPLRILFFSSCWLRTYYVVQAELKLLAILLSQTPEF